MKTEYVVVAGPPSVCGSARRIHRLPRPRESRRARSSSTNSGSWTGSMTRSGCNRLKGQESASVQVQHVEVEPIDGEAWKVTNVETKNYASL